jgi:hypothetical protein
MKTLLAWLALTGSIAFGASGVIGLLLSTSATAQINQRILVPDAETAIEIAVAVFKPLYGSEKIQQSFQADLQGDTWSVFVSPVLSNGRTMRGGGNPEAKISQIDGRITDVHLSR